MYICIYNYIYIYVLYEGVINWTITIMYSHVFALWCLDNQQFTRAPAHPKQHKAMTGGSWR